MTQRLLFPVLLALAAALASGCSMMKKSPAPTENPSIAGQTEDSLKQRWIERRAAELVAQGLAADAARAKATDEFREKYPYAGGGQK